MTAGLLEALTALTHALPEAAALIAEPDRQGRAAVTLPPKASRPPWNAAVANAILDTWATVRDLETDMRYEVTGQPWRGRGGSDANTEAAIQAIADLASFVARTTVGDASHRVHRLEIVIGQLPAIDVEECWQRVHGAECFHCHVPMLCLAPRSGQVACLRGGADACFDCDGNPSRGFVRRGLDGEPLVEWADGCLQYGTAVSA